MQSGGIRRQAQDIMWWLKVLDELIVSAESTRLGRNHLMFLEAEMKRAAELT
jgi:hypothetical protein